jgi:putative membrane-bound dehydrogenase-like protein
VRYLPNKKLYHCLSASEILIQKKSKIKTAYLLLIVIKEIMGHYNPPFFGRLHVMSMIVFVMMVSCHNNDDINTHKPASATDTANSGISAENALSTFELEPGFKIELLASEPLISDPVDMEIDEYGHLYVVEMPGYPLDKSGSGKIKLLTDTNSDGRMDKSTVFADGLVLPNSIMRWKKGVIVTDAPAVLYLEDSNNDGVADVRDTILTGFALSNPQHNLNSPVLSIDNWIYLGHEGAVTTETYKKEFGDPGTEIYFPKQPNSPRLPPNASGRSVRFQPDQHKLETTSSNTQFGHSFDTWGHHFLVENWNHCIQEVMAAPYLKRNPDLLVSNATAYLSDHADAAEVFPITKNPEHQLLTDVGVITSACGITFYQGGTFPDSFNNNIMLVAEPVSNLIHIDRLKDKGATFVASRIHPNKEFLASTDSWCRPVNMYVGPDGALYVVDYYREIIEHPEWMGEEVVKSGKLYNGSDKGRIYRISSTNAKPVDWTKGLKLGNESNEQLVQELSSSNIWWRLNAQRLLVDHQDKAVVPALVKMAQNANSPVGRLHGLWTLEGIKELQPGLIEQALKDPVAGVRENAIKLAELHMVTAPGLTKALLSLQADPDAKVRFQLLCTLGSVNTPEALHVRNKLLFGDINDPWVQIAALSASSSQTALLLNAVLDSFRQDVPAYASLVKRLTAMIGASGSSAVIHQLVQKATVQTPQQHAWQAPVLEGLAEGLRSKKTHAGINEQEILIKTFFEHPSDPLRKASLEMLKVTGVQNKSLLKNAIERAVSIAGDESQSTDKRVEAINFMALGDPAPHAEFLQKLISSNEQSSVQIAALRTLSVIPGNSFSQHLLKQWSSLTPDIQNEAINTFLTDTGRISLLLDAIEAGHVQPTSIGWQRSVELMAQSNFRLRDKARRLLTKSEKESVEVNKKYEAALSMKSYPQEGKTVFTQNCSSCHQVRGSMGLSFGPDLGTIHNWTAEAIMANILAPNLSISSGFDLWQVDMKNGESFQGIISSETTTAVTLKNAAQQVKTINRKDIKSLRALNMSAMTSGLEKQINQQQMADLIAFLRQNK